MEQIPLHRGGMLRCHTKSVPSGRPRVGLEVVLLSVLEASTNPSSLEFLKLSILIYLDGKHPSASDIVVNLMTSLVSERHGSKIRKTSECLNSSSLVCLISLAYFLETSWVITDSAFGCFLPFLARYCSNWMKPLTS